MGVGHRAVFLDRDGVINVDTGYVHTVEDFTFLPGAIDAMARLQAAGYILIIITNQSGIGRGYFTDQAFRSLTSWMTEQLKVAGVNVRRTYHCPHVPVDDLALACRCRKPAPGLILAAAEEFDLNLAQSILVGDKPTDIAAGRAAGVRQCFQLGSAHAASGEADGYFADLSALVEWLTRR